MRVLHRSALAGESAAACLSKVPLEEMMAAVQQPVVFDLYSDPKVAGCFRSFNIQPHPGESTWADQPPAYFHRARCPLIAPFDSESF